PRPLSAAAGVLTITPEEVRTVSSRQASARPDVWKAMLWGGPRDLELIDRLRASFPPVQEIAEKQGWTTRRGYQVSGVDEIDASHLNGLPDIPTTSVLPLRLAEPVSALSTFQREHLHRTRDLSLFKGPHVLVRRTVANGKLSAVLLDADAAFTDG